MKRTIQVLAVIIAMAWSYEFKHVSAQAQSTTPIEIGDANMLPVMKPTMARVNVKRVYGADLQFEYYWKAGTPTGARTQEFIYKRYIIIGTSPQGGYWTTPKAFIDAENVLNLDSLLRTRGFVSGTGLATRIAADSLRLVSEIARATAAEATKLSSYTETDPLSVPKTRLVNGKVLSADITLTTTDVAEGTNQYFTTARALAAISGAGYIKGVQLGGGSATFTTSSLLAGGTVNVTVPLNTTFTATDYQVTQPTIISTAGVAVLSTLSATVVTKNTNSVVVTIRNNALLSLAVTGTIDVVALKAVN